MSSVDNYIPEGNIETWWYPLEAFEDDRAPTVAELNAGTRLTADLEGRPSMARGGSKVALDPQHTDWIAEVPGKQGGETWTITLRHKIGDHTLYNMFPRLEQGYLAKSWDHPTATWAVGDILDLGQVIVMANNENTADTVQYAVDFTVPCLPLFDYIVAS